MVGHEPIGSEPLVGLSADAMARLHRRVITNREEILDLLLGAQVAGARLDAGMDQRNRPRLAIISEVSGGLVRLHTENISLGVDGPLYFGFAIGDCRYFFRAIPSGYGDGYIELPPVLYQSERRDTPRDAQRHGEEVEVLDSAGTHWSGRIEDSSYQGLGVSVLGPGATPSGPVTIKFHGDSALPAVYGQLRNATSWQERERWGLLVSSVPFQAAIPVLRTDAILNGEAAGRFRRILSFAGAAAKAIPRRIVTARRAHLDIPVVAYRNAQGHPIKAIVDQTGADTGGTAVVIPPAWGRTKETLLPLAAALLASFKAIGETLTVIRFDGTFRRGESYVPPDCRGPGREALRFTFSQGVEDILSSVDFVRERYKPDRVVLVTFSLASIDGRRAVALNPEGAIDGWVCVVGMGDLQSGLRAVSGGIDYGFGLLSGVKFGVHKLGGVAVDMDNAGRDVLEHRLGFLEDARRDFGDIEAPVTWIHGRHDGWIDVERVRMALSAGCTADRKLIEVPTGHQLRNSRDALETFQLISGEVAKMALGHEAPPVWPDLARLELRSRAERARLAEPMPDIRSFWRRYLTGDEMEVGMELLTSTRAYQDFMTRQVDLLGQQPGAVVLDLGAGVGDLAVSLRDRHALLEGPMRVIQIDFIVPALKRAKARAAEFGGHVSQLAADLVRPIPIPTASVDAVVASLLLSYIPNPEGLLKEIRRVLKPGGILVASVPKRDADMSLIYSRGLAELNPDRVRELFGVDVEQNFESIQREFLDSGASLLALEEMGFFRFWEPDEFAQLLSGVGFGNLAIEKALGSPGQAVLARAERH